MVTQAHQPAIHSPSAAKIGLHRSPSGPRNTSFANRSGGPHAGRLRDSQARWLRTAWRKRRVAL